MTSLRRILRLSVLLLFGPAEIAHASDQIPDPVGEVLELKRVALYREDGDGKLPAPVEQALEASVKLVATYFVSDRDEPAVRFEPTNWELSGMFRLVRGYSPVPLVGAALTTAERFNATKPGLDGDRISALPGRYEAEAIFAKSVAQPGDRLFEGAELVLAPGRNEAAIRVRFAGRRYVALYHVTCAYFEAGHCAATEPSPTDGAVLSLLTPAAPATGSQLARSSRGCGCALAGRTDRSAWPLAIVLGFGLYGARRRGRRRPS